MPIDKAILKFKLYYIKNIGKKYANENLVALDLTELIVNIKNSFR